MRNRVFALAGVMVAVATPAMACEPIVPLAMLFLGPMNALRWGAWVLLAVVVVKCALFAAFQRSMRWRTAFGAMFGANILSSIVGVAAAIGFAAPMLLPFGLIGVAVLTILPARRLRDLRRWRISTSSVVTFAIAAFVGTIVLFGLAQTALFSNRLWLYWLLKVAYIEVAILISLGLTIFWEEWVVSGIASPSGVLLSPVARANAFVLGGVMLGTAIAVLPERLRSPNFLISLLFR